MSMLMSIFSNSSFLNKKLVSVSMLECHEYADIQKFAKQVPLYLLSAFTYPSIKSKARLLQHIFSKYLSSSLPSKYVVFRNVYLDISQPYS